MALTSISNICHIDKATENIIFCFLGWNWGGDTIGRVVTPLENAPWANLALHCIENAIDGWRRESGIRVALAPTLDFDKHKQKPPGKHTLIMFMAHFVWDPIVIFVLDLG